MNQMTVAADAGPDQARRRRPGATGTDMQARAAAAALSDPQPQIDHYLATDVHE
jgi:hypothetical protein